VEVWVKVETLEMNTKERSKHVPAFVFRLIMHSRTVKCEFNILLCHRIINEELIILTLGSRSIG
jgi:hypothetical protein